MVGALNLKDILNFVMSYLKTLLKQLNKERKRKQMSEERTLEEMARDRECIYYQMSRFQRMHDREQGNGDFRTKRYDGLGCYSCSGFNDDCSVYRPRKRESQSE